MPLLTTRQVRQIVRNTGLEFDGCWTDKCARDSSIRRVSWRFMDPQDANKAADELAEAYKRANALGASISRTSVDWDEWARTTGGEYVRINAVLP